MSGVRSFTSFCKTIEKNLGYGNFLRAIVDGHEKCFFQHVNVKAVQLLIDNSLDIRRLKRKVRSRLNKHEEILMNG